MSYSSLYELQSPIVCTRIASVVRMIGVACVNLKQCIVGICVSAVGCAETPFVTFMDVLAFVSIGGIDDCDDVYVDRHGRMDGLPFVSIEAMALMSTDALVSIVSVSTDVLVSVLLSVMVFVSMNAMGYVDEDGQTDGLSFVSIETMALMSTDMVSIVSASTYALTACVVECDDVRIDECDGVYVDGHGWTDGLPFVSIEAMPLTSTDALASIGSASTDALGSALWRLMVFVSTDMH